MMRSSLRTRVAIASLAALAAGCLGGTPQPKFYTLSEASGPAAGAALASLPDLGLVVGPIEFPRYLDRPEIVSRDGANQLVVADAHRWGGSLRNDILRVVGDDLGRLLSGTARRLTRTGRLLRRIASCSTFASSRACGTRVVLRVRWTIAATSDGHAVFVADSRFAQPVASAAVADMVAAESAALGTLIRQIAERLVESRPSDRCQGERGARGTLVDGGTRGCVVGACSDGGEGAAVAGRLPGCARLRRGARGGAAAEPDAQDLGGQQAAHQPGEQHLVHHVQQNDFKVDPGFGGSQRWSTNLLLQPVLRWRSARIGISSPARSSRSSCRSRTARGQSHGHRPRDGVRRHHAAPAGLAESGARGKLAVRTRSDLDLPTAGSTFTGQGNFRSVRARSWATCRTSGSPACCSRTGGRSPARIADEHELDEPQPFVSYFLPDAWSIGYSGNILANWKNASDDTFTVPIGVGRQGGEIREAAGADLARRAVDARAAPSLRPEMEHPAGRGAGDSKLVRAI
jgi:uncharacterized lipoprotein YmbA